MTPETTLAIHAHALRDFPREACGVVIVEAGEEVYIPCRNVARTPSEHFIIHPQDYGNADERGEIILIVHSHPNVPARPSQGDKVACERTGVPWYIVAVWKEGGDATARVVGDCQFEPSGYQAPLVGREFTFGVLDCYTLIRDWYRIERGITLPEFDRRDNFWKKGNEIDLYAQYGEAGFVEVTDGTLQVGDVILMQMRANIANHAGVYIGDGLILHHLYGKLSGRDVYGGFWKNVTRRIVRRE